MEQCFPAKTTQEIYRDADYFVLITAACAELERLFYNIFLHMLSFRRSKKNSFSGLEKYEHMTY